MSTEKKIYMSTDYTGEASAPHQYFVTDADGKGKWEEKLAYSYTERTKLLDNATTEITDLLDIIIKTRPSGVPEDGSTVYVTVDGVTQEMPCKYVQNGDNQFYVVGNLMNFGGEDNGLPYVFYGLVSNAPIVDETNPDRTCYIVFQPGSGSMPQSGSTVTLEVIEEKVNPVDPKFLGNDQGAYKQLVTDENGKAVWEERTHYISYDMVEVLPETTTTLEMEGAIMTPLTNPLTTGRKAIVNYNGTDYESIVGEMESGEDENGNPIIMKYCGNPALAFGDETLDNGMPFVFAEAPAAFQAQGVYAMFVPIDYFESGDAIVSVKVDGTVIHKLDTKYLPKYDWNAEPNTEGYIANRTHYTANVGTIVYDAANLAGVDSVNIAEGQTAYKVSDYILSKEAIQNAELYIAESATGEKVKVEKTEAYETEEYIICSVDSLFIIVFKQLKQTVLGELKVPSTGVYISTNVPYAELVVGEYVKPLDTKYIDTTELATQTEISEINNRISNINGSIININNTITAIRTKLEYEYRLNYDIELKQAMSEINLLTEDRQGLYKSLRIKVFIPKAEIEGSCGINIKGRDVNTTKLIISNSISTMEDKYITIDVDGEYKYIDITGTLTNGAGNTSKDIYKLGYSYYMYATSPIYEAKLLTYPPSTESVFPIGTKVKVWGVYAA